MVEKIKKAKKIIQRDWYLINAEQKVLGKIATKIAVILQGKNKVNYLPNVDSGDYVIVTNAKKIILTGRKTEQKVYIHHTGYIGSLKTIKFKKLIKQNPELVMKKAVFGMLPKNKLRNERLKRLRIYPELPENKFSQKIIKLEIK
jgi:large subunit ribosomal protein L13